MTILAAVIPYHCAACTVVIRDTAQPGAYLASEDIPVGRLACDEHDTFPCEVCAAKPRGRGVQHFRRVVGPAEVAAVVAAVAGLVREHGAQEVLCESPPDDSVEAERGRTVGAALLDIGAALVPGAGGTDLAARLGVLLKDEGPDGRGVGVEPLPGASSPGAEVIPRSAALPLARGVAVLPEGLDSQSAAPPSYDARLPGDQTRRLEPTPALAAAQAYPLLADGSRDPRDRSPAACGTCGKPVEEGRLCYAFPICYACLPPPPPLPLAKAGPRIAGIDPGSKHVAVVILEGAAPPLRFVAALSLTLGRDVSLDKPKRVAPKDGRAPYEKTTRHEVTDADVDAMLRDVAAFLALHEADEAVVETAAFAFEGAGALLLRSNRIGGVIEGALRGTGLPVRTTTSKAWRGNARKMAGVRPRGGASDGDPRVEDMARGLPSDGRGPEGARGAEGGSDVRGGGHAAPAGVGAGQSGRVRLDRDGAHGAVHGSGPDEAGHARDAGAVRAPAGPRDHVGPVAPDWRPAVRALVPTLPPDAGAHILDAAGCALFAVAPPPEVRPAPARQRAPKGQRKPKGNEARRARQDRARAAMGCLGEVCRARGKMGHDPACPVAIARAARVSESMMGKRNAAKGVRT